MCLRLIGKQLMSRAVNRCLNPKVFTRCERWFDSLATGGSGSYEGDGKTVVTIVNKDLAGYLMLDTYSSQGFRLSNGLFAFGPIAIFPSTVLQWDVASAEDIDEKSLSLFALVEPRIECLVIGVGDDTEQNRKSTELNRRLRSILRSMRINCEVLPTKHAVTTYNYLLIDHRVCAGAFIPPMNPDIDYSVDPWLESHNRRFITSDGKPVFQ